MYRAVRCSGVNLDWPKLTEDTSNSTHRLNRVIRSALKTTSTEPSSQWKTAL
jgi:hypothetical protein